jgi:hypothetical protein
MKCVFGLRAAVPAKENGMHKENEGRTRIREKKSKMRHTMATARPN